VGKERDQIAFHDQPQVSDEDLTNFAAVHTLRHGNSVHALPLEEMPSGTSMAAIYHATHT
jgi:hypothetical protein